MTRYVKDLHTFSIGLAGSPDLIAARRVAAHLGTIHHEFTFTVEEGLDAVSDLIYHIESYEQVIAHVCALESLPGQLQEGMFSH